MELFSYNINYGYIEHVNNWGTPIISFGKRRWSWKLPSFLLCSFTSKPVVIDRYTFIFHKQVELVLLTKQNVTKLQSIYKASLQF